MSYIGYYNECCGDQNNDTVTNKYFIEEKTFNFIAEKFKYYSINTINNIVRVTLPSGSSIQNGEWIGFIDSIGNFGINNLIINYNGSDKIRNNAGDLIVDLNYINFKLVFNNGNWNVLDMSITSVTSNSSGGSTITSKYDIVDVNSDFTIQPSKIYITNTINSAINVTLPTTGIQNGDWVGFSDSIGNFGTNNLVIKYNGSSTIRNNAGDLVVDLNYINFKLIYSNGNWNVFDMSIASTIMESTGGGISDSRYNLINVNSNFTAIPLRLYAVNTTSNTVTVTLPSTVQNGDWIDFIDNAGKFGTNKLIIAYNGIHSIRGNNGNLEVDLNFINFRLVFNNGNWSVIDMSMSIIISGDGGTTINPTLTPNQLTQVLDYIESNVDFINNLTLNSTQLNQVLSYTQSNDKYIVSEVSGVINAVKSNYYLVNTSSNVATINLPSSPTVGDWIIISDKNKTFATNNAVVVFASPRTIGANADNFVLDVSGAKVKLVYCTNNWDVLSLS